MKKRLLGICIILSLIVNIMVIPASALTNEELSDKSNVQIGDCIELGHYLGEPIVWRCIGIDENGPLMLSDKVLCLKSYDAKGNSDTHYVPGSFSTIRKSYGSNCWADSNLREWLNSNEDSVSWSHDKPSVDNVYNGYNAYDTEAGFLTYFTDEELNYVSDTTQKVYTNEAEYIRGLTDGGTSEYWLTSGQHLEDLSLDFSDIYYQYVTDKFFVPNVIQLMQAYNNIGKDYIIAYPTRQAVNTSNFSHPEFSENMPCAYWINHPGTTGYSYEHMNTIGKDGNMSSTQEWNTDHGGAYISTVGVRPAFYLNTDGLNEDDLDQEELKEEYVNQHVDYYQSSYDEEIVSMAFTNGLGFLLEDAEGDFSDWVYSTASVLVADMETITTFINATSYIDIDWGNEKKFSLKIPAVSLMDLGSSEYSVMLYQLIASDDVYSGILDTFSVNYEKNAKKFIQLLSDSSVDLVKKENAAEWNTAHEALENAITTINTADPGSTEFSAAYKNFERLGNEYLDLDKTKKYLKGISTSAENAFTFMGSILDEIDSISKAYQYICWAESYAETSEAFKDVLKALSVEADKKAEELYYMGSPEDFANPYSDANRYKGLSKAINSFITTMDAYAKDSHKEFIKNVIDDTGDTCVDLAIECLTDKVLGGSICPQLTVINTALSSGKLLIDLFTNIDDEYKMILMVKSYEMISELLLKVSNEYGNNMLMKEYIDPSDIYLQPVPVTLDMKFSFATRFDECIKMYKNAMSLACDYGIEYEKSRLAYASNMASQIAPDWWYETGATTEWQIQASTSSTAISLLAYQKNHISDIHCHDDGLIYDHSTGMITYNSSRKVIVTACPVDVTVTAPDGTQLAYMTNGSAIVASGYEPYFHIIPSNKNNGDYIKVAVIPDNDNYQVSIDGTGNGAMSIFIAAYDGGNYSEFKESLDFEMFVNYGVTDSTTGYITSGDKDNSLGYLVLNNTVYGEGCFVVTFDANGGTLADDSKAQTSKSGQLISLPNNPTHVDSYNFGGWYTAPDGGTLITNDYVFSEDTIVYAHWINDSINATSVKLDHDNLTLYIDETITLKATVFPENATNRTVVWTSSNPEIVTVDANGKITAVKNGVATITVTTQDGNYTAFCEVRVDSDTSNGGAHHPESNGSSSSSDRYEISTPSDVENGSIKVSDSKAENGDTITITITPDEGYELDALAVHAEDGDEIDLEDEGDGKYTFEMPKSDVEIEVAFVAIADKASKADFADVAADTWYADAVQYVFENDLMDGTSETTFSPNLTTTRGMIVTILYRLENEPAVTGTTAFTDVAADQYYADAVAWAAQNGIVAGIDATTFAPNKAITREQMAAILYRYAQFKDYDVSAKADLSVYTDAASVGAYATDAMAWANGAQLITGTSATTLSPAGNATRAQVAAILMRFCENIAK